MDEGGKGEQFTTVSLPGTGGLHTIVDAQDIDDTEMSDCRNVIFTGGYVTPRQGFQQLFAKPTGETQAPNTLAVGETSDGVDLMVTIYGSNFYLWDPKNQQNILLNTDSPAVFQGAPGATGYQKFWSYDTWLGGVGTDVMYFANGVDNTTKWQMSLQYAAFPAMATDSQILISYPNRMAATGGNLIAMLSGTPTGISYFSVSPVLSITTGASVTSFALISSNSSNITANPSTGLYTFSMNVNPSNGNTLTFDINGTPVMVNFVLAIGSTPGNCLIGSSIDNTMINLYNLLTDPGGTTATQVAFSTPNQALIQYSFYNTYNYSAIYFSGTIGTAIPAGTAITTPLAQTSNIPTCSIVKALQTRMWAIGGKGTENQISWSQTLHPENFTSFANNNTDPGETLWGEGTGAVTAIIDGGGFIYFMKVDSLAQGQFIYGQTTDTTYIFSLVEFASGNDIGVSNFKRVLKNQSNVDYLTAGNGVTELQNVVQSNSSDTANAGSSVSFSLISQKINDRLINPTKIYHFTYANAFYFSQRGFWAVSSTQGNPNDLLLMYDYEFQYWTVFDGWNVQDMNDSSSALPNMGDQMYFLSNTDGSVNQCFTGYQDGANPYTAYYITKRYDLGYPAMTKTADCAFLQGLITQGTTMYCDIMFNENGSLGKQTYAIQGTNTTYVSGIPTVGALGQFPMGTAPLGASQSFSAASPTYFRAYPQVSIAAQWHNISYKFYSTDIGSSWAIDKIGILAEAEMAHPNSLDIGPGTPTVLVPSNPSNDQGYDVQGFDVSGFDT